MARKTRSALIWAAKRQAEYDTRLAIETLSGIAKASSMNNAALLIARLIQRIREETTEHITNSDHQG